jgi:hypothetical protein
LDQFMLHYQGGMIRSIRVNFQLYSWICDYIYRGVHLCTIFLLVTFILVINTIL